MGWKDPLEKEMVTHSSILAWRTPWTEELGVLQSIGSQELDMTGQLTLSLFTREACRVAISMYKLKDFLTSVATKLYCEL